MVDSLLHPDDAKLFMQRYARMAEQGINETPRRYANEKNQSLRQAVHAMALQGERPSILEVGCGIGSFYKHLMRRERDFLYCGYDVLPENVAECKRNFPLGRFEVRNVFFEGIKGTFDTVVISQLLNNRYQKSDNMKIMHMALELAFKHSRVSASVDMLSDSFQFRNSEWFYYSPMEIFRFAKTITDRVVIRHDYMDSEFCIQLFHCGTEGYSG
jgi:tRNA G46 methylase TrmB